MENKKKNYKQCDMCKVNEATSLCPSVLVIFMMHAISQCMA